MLTLFGSTLPVTELGMVTFVGAWNPALRYVALPVFLAFPLSPLAFRRAFLMAERSSYDEALFICSMCVCAGCESEGESVCVCVCERMCACMYL